MKDTPKTPFNINTLEKALHLAHTLTRDLTRKGTKASRGFQAFSALTSSEIEALAAFFIWRGRSEAIKELAKQR